MAAARKTASKGGTKVEIGGQEYVVRPRTLAVARELGTHRERLTNIAAGRAEVEARILHARSELDRLSQEETFPEDEVRKAADSLGDHIRKLEASDEAEAEVMLAMIATMLEGDVSGEHLAAYVDLNAVAELAEEVGLTPTGPHSRD